MIVFYTMEPEKGAQKLPKWVRSYGKAKTGEIYVPITFGDPEYIVNIMVKEAGFQTYIYLDHIYIPTTWLIANMPESREFCISVIAYAHDSTIPEINNN